jgi:ABC-type phosphate transport system ATPase subunit
MHELIMGARVEGEVLLDDQDIYASNADPVSVRRQSLARLACCMFGAWKTMPICCG